ncbi:DNA polymerase III subunit alpha [Salimicrobium flavidum]|uniref:DNA polymerase III subunit alpha n=1 Tax=Salimicrobium flavidum TaxID=570947 RepID=A0A1N7JR04_9BACI|nr:DNA polymerase III subunit alpha [Salimicrobium flavidum]SIS51747.1 DNA polymerase III catalytic subunit, DnaE type [Salimicrobium flavidum]
MSYTHIGVKSGYSLMDSTINIDALVDKVSSQGASAVGLADLGSVSAWLTFYNACKNEGITPLLGVEVPLVSAGESYPVIMIAESEHGVGNILEITSYHHMKGNVILEEIQDLGEDVTAIWRTRETPVAQAVMEGREREVLSAYDSFRAVFPSMYIGVMATEYRQEQMLHGYLKQWERKNGIKCTAISDVRFLQEEDRETYEVLRAMKAGAPFEKGDSPLTITSLHNPSETESFFGDWPEVIENNEKIVSRAQVELQLSRSLLPSYPLKDQTSDEYLRKLCEEALNERYRGHNEEASERLDHELEVISSRQFSDYFLIVWDFVTFAKNSGIKVGPGRGSSAGSIVAYLLDITTVDPLEHGLLFERFLNPERQSMPDIDIDFSDHRRDEVITYVREKYGSDHVAQICTFGTFAARSTIREVGKALSVEEGDIAYILKQFPSDRSMGLQQIVKRSETLKSFIRSSEQMKRLFRIGSKIEGLPRHVSTHAAGVVISDHSLRRYTGMMDHDGPALLTQMAMGDVESLGLVKMDFLGLRNLSFLENVEKNIQKYKDSSFSIEAIPAEDEKTFEQLAKGRTNGIFQLESKGMRKVLRQLKPERFGDIVAVNALYRPGPMDFIPDYIERKHGTTQVTYPHKKVEPILRETYGVLVYQEQIMKIVQIVAGYSLGEADLFRRAVSKKQEEVITQQESRFLKGAGERGFEEGVAKELFSWIVRFSNYGFNKSHAVAYSFISYRLAFIKTHYPEYFLAELLNSATGDKEKIADYIREAKQGGLAVKPPYMNEAFPQSSVRGGSIVLGFMLIKGIGYKVGQSIVQERENGRFTNFFDFAMRCASFLDRNAIEVLVKAGSFDRLHSNRASLLASIEQALDQSELFREFQGDTGFLAEWSGQLVEKDPLPSLKRLNLEKEVLGTILSAHPLEEARKSLQKRGVDSLYAATRRKSGQISTAGVVDKIREIRTKRGEKMAFLTLSDEKDEMEAVVFPEVYRDCSAWLEEEMIVVSQGKIQDRKGERQLQVQKIRQMEEVREIFIKTAQEQYWETLGSAKSVAEDFPGEHDILLYVEDEQKAYKMPEGYRVSLGENVQQRFRQKFGDTRVAVRKKWK